MANVEKKKQKMKERIEQLENELTMSLQKKAAGPAINVSAYTIKIQDMKKELAALK